MIQTIERILRTMGLPLTAENYEKCYRAIVADDTNRAALIGECLAVQMEAGGAR